MPNWDSLLNPNFIYLIPGCIFIFAAVVSMRAGKTYGRFGVSASRSEEPAQFWWGVALYFLGGIFFIGIYMRSIFPEAIFHPERWVQSK
jgi:hypothetical protein